MKVNKCLLCMLALVATFTLTLAPAGHAVAEDLVIPVGAQADREHLNYPKMGASQSSVRAHWGEPQAIEGPVGEPAITQWAYKNFIVYFEGTHVLHTVLKQHR